MDDLAYLSFDADFSSPRIIDAYDELPLWSAMFGLLLLDEVPLGGVRAALDVGCGTGFPLIELAERLGPAVEMHGLDPWNGGLARAREKMECRATPNVTLHSGVATSMPFEDGKFDLIVSSLGINNFDDRAGAVQECRRVAKEGATLALATNLQGHMQEFYAVYEQVLTQHGSEAQLGALRAHVEHRATIPGVCTLLEGGGFSVTRVVERTARMRFANGTALMNHHFIKLGFLDGWKTVVRGDEQTMFRHLQKQLDRSAERHGELSLTVPMAYVEAKAR